MPRALTPEQLSQQVISVQKGQAKNAAAKQAKTAANKKITDNVPKAKTDGYSKLSPDQRAKEDAANAKKTAKAKPHAIMNAQKTAKQDRADKWADPTKRKAASQQPKKSKPSKLPADDKKQVKDALKGAANRMQNTKDIPARKDKFTVGGSASRSTTL